MSRQHLLSEFDPLVELKKQSMLPTVKDVILGYNYRMNELKQGKGANFRPKQYDVLILPDEIKNFMLLFS